MRVEAPRGAAPAPGSLGVSEASPGQRKVSLPVEREDLWGPFQPKLFHFAIPRKFIHEPALPRAAPVFLGALRADPRKGRSPGRAQPAAPRPRRAPPAPGGIPGPAALGMSAEEPGGKSRSARGSIRAVPAWTDGSEMERGGSSGNGAGSTGNSTGSDSRSGTRDNTGNGSGNRTGNGTGTGTRNDSGNSGSGRAAPPGGAVRALLCLALLLLLPPARALPTPARALPTPARALPTPARALPTPAPLAHCLNSSRHLLEVAKDSLQRLKERGTLGFNCTFEEVDMEDITKNQTNTIRACTVEDSGPGNCPALERSTFDEGKCLRGISEDLRAYRAELGSLGEPPLLEALNALLQVRVGDSCPKPTQNPENREGKSQFLPQTLNQNRAGALDVTRYPNFPLSLFTINQISQIFPLTHPYFPVLPFTPKGEKIQGIFWSEPFPNAPQALGNSTGRAPEAPLPSGSPGSVGSQSLGSAGSAGSAGSPGSVGLGSLGSSGSPGSQSSGSSGSSRSSGSSGSSGSAGLGSSGSSGSPGSPDLPQFSEQLHLCSALLALRVRSVTISRMLRFLSSL
ncbi:interleukin-12 subunit alpha [Prinia subflava]|uniref:interleukin-12 subunit alpha n=1 Tax=Prinia subflava TaxID=208062 RepID=UPI002FE0616A